MASLAAAVAWGTLAMDEWLMMSASVSLSVVCQWCVPFESCWCITAGY